MSKTIILHIGRHKSGTSAIQDFLFENVSVLAERGIHYPETGRFQTPLAHHTLAHACIAARPEHKKLAQFKRRLRAETASFNKVILSSEGFQNVTNLNFVRRLIGDMDTPLAPSNALNVRILAYVREYLSYATSSYAQSVQNTDLAVSFATYVNDLFKVDLQAFCARWRTMSDDVTFRPFHRTQLWQGDVVDDFCNTLGLGDLPKSKSATSNPSISGNLLVFKLILNANGLAHPELYRHLENLARQNASWRGRFHISAAKADTYRGQFPSYNEAFARHVGVPVLDDFSSAAPLFDPDNWAKDIDVFLSDAGIGQFIKDEPTSLFTKDAASQFA